MTPSLGCGRGQLRTRFTRALLVAIPVLFVVAAAGVRGGFASVVGGSRAAGHAREVTEYTGGGDDEEHWDGDEQRQRERRPQLFPSEDEAPGHRTSHLPPRSS